MGWVNVVGAGRGLVVARGSRLQAWSVLRFERPATAALGLALLPHSPSPHSLTPLLRLVQPPLHSLRASSPSASPAPTLPASPGARRPLPPSLPGPTCRQWRRRPLQRLPVAWPAPALRPSSRRLSGSSRRGRSAPAAAWRAAPLARLHSSTLVSGGWLAGQDEERQWEDLCNLGRWWWLHLRLASRFQLAQPHLPGPSSTPPLPRRLHGAGAGVCRYSWWPRRHGHVLRAACSNRPAFDNQPARQSSRPAKQRLVRADRQAGQQAITAAGPAEFSRRAAA